MQTSRIQTVARQKTTRESKSSQLRCHSLERHVRAAGELVFIAAWMSNFVEMTG